MKYVEAMVGQQYQLVTVSSPDWEKIADQIERAGLVPSDLIAIVKLSDLEALMEKAALREAVG